MTLKHTISTLKVFGKTNIQFGYMDYDLDYTMITVHLEWNLIFFVGAKRRIIAYDMDRRKVNVIPASVDHSYGRRKVLSWFMSRPYFLPYVPVFLFLESLVEQWIKLHLMYLCVTTCSNGPIYVVWLSMAMLISFRMDVAIIATKLVCHLNLLCFQIGIFLWHEQYVMVVLQLHSPFHTVIQR